MKFAPPIILSTLVVVVATAICMVAGTNEDISFWISKESGYWHDPTRWSNGIVPGPQSHVYINMTGSYVVTIHCRTAVKIAKLVLGDVGDGVQQLVVKDPVNVSDEIVVGPSGILNITTDIMGDGSITVHGKFLLRYYTHVGIKEVEISERGSFAVWYYPYEAHGIGDSDKCTLNTFLMPPQPLFPVQHLPVVGTTTNLIDPIFGSPIADGLISIIVPSTKGQQSLTLEEHKKYVFEVSKQLSNIAGGSTSIPGTGYWYSPEQGVLQQETVTVVQVAVRMTNQIKLEFKRLAEWLAEELEQEAVFVSVNQQSFLVSSTSS